MKKLLALLLVCCVAWVGLACAKKGSTTGGDADTKKTTGASAREKLRNNLQGSGGDTQPAP